MLRFIEDIILFTLAFYILRRLFSFAWNVFLGNASRTGYAPKPPRSETSTEKGTIQVNFAPPTKKSKDRDMGGEFIDYEEIKNTK